MPRYSLLTGEEVRALGVPTFIENNPIPGDRMNWTLFGCEVSCKRVVRG